MINHEATSERAETPSDKRSDIKSEIPGPLVCSNAVAIVVVAAVVGKGNQNKRDERERERERERVIESERARERERKEQGAEAQTDNFGPPCFWLLR